MFKYKIWMVVDNKGVYVTTYEFIKKVDKAEAQRMVNRNYPDKGYSVGPIG